MGNGYRLNWEQLSKKPSIFLTLPSAKIGSSSADAHLRRLAHNTRIL